MIHANHAHLPGQARFVCRADVFVIGTDRTGNQVVRRPWLEVTMDVYTRTIVGGKAALPMGTNSKKSTE